MSSPEILFIILSMFTYTLDLAAKRPMGQDAKGNGIILYGCDLPEEWNDDHNKLYYGESHIDLLI